MLREPFPTVSYHSRKSQATPRRKDKWTQTAIDDETATAQESDDSECESLSEDAVAEEEDGGEEEDDDKAEWFDADDSADWTPDGDPAQSDQTEQEIIG